MENTREATHKQAAPAEREAHLATPAAYYVGVLVGDVFDGEHHVGEPAAEVHNEALHCIDA